MNIKLIFLMTCLSVLVGCESKTVQKEQYSGYLSDYSRLEEMQTASGGTTLRWVNPDFKERGYHSVLIEKTQLYPKPQPDKQVTQKVLNEFSLAINQALKSSAQPSFKVVDFPGKGVLSIRPAITGVVHSVEGIQPVEVLPVALLVGLGKVVTGTRDRDVEVFLEIEIIDSNTGDLMAQAVRKAEGSLLENDSEKLTMAHLKGVITNWTKDAVTVFTSLAPTGNH